MTSAGVMMRPVAPASPLMMTMDVCCVRDVCSQVIKTWMRQLTDSPAHTFTASGSAPEQQVTLLVLWFAEGIKRLFHALCLPPPDLHSPHPHPHPFLTIAAVIPVMSPAYNQ